MKERIGILGTGLVGTLLSILLAKKGYQVETFEKRPDPRKHDTSEGRSINLALSHRGIKALKMAGVFDHIEPQLIPMYGRSIHQADGITFHSYGTKDQHINSVSRHRLNALLIEHAQSLGVILNFDTLVENVDLKDNTLVLNNGSAHSFDGLIGADGAFSKVRKMMVNQDNAHVAEEELLAHSYKELTIPPVADDFALAPNSLHIWPRRNFMLIALPNIDRSFTCTLFLPTYGDPSFDQMDSEDQITRFFEDVFPEILPLMPDYLRQFKSNPTSSLHTIKAYPWVKYNSLLIGDAAHAIVPFYGQGMNAGFEDCRILLETLEQNNYNWGKSILQFQDDRKKDTDAIAQLALQNFLEMRDHVIDEEFLKRKALETRLHQTFPDDWLPLYSMVTFSDIPYHQALKTGKLQLAAIKTLGRNYDPKSVDLESLLNVFNTLKKDDR